LVPLTIAVLSAIFTIIPLKLKLATYVSNSNDDPHSIQS